MIQRSVQCAGVLAACVALLVGCATPPTKPPGMLSCSDEEHCRVQVYVSCFLHYWPCTVSVDIAKVQARGNNVFWDLQDEPDGKRFRFDPASGIEFKKQGNGFRCMPVSAGRSYKCDNGKVPGEHEYGVKVIGDVFVPRLDPWVVN